MLLHMVSEAILFFDQEKLRTRRTPAPFITMPDPEGEHTSQEMTASFL